MYRQIDAMLRAKHLSNLSTSFPSIVLLCRIMRASVDKANVQNLEDIADWVGKT